MRGDSEGVEVRVGGCDGVVGVTRETAGRWQRRALSKQWSENKKRENEG